MKARLGDGDGKLQLGGEAQQFGGFEAFAESVGGASSPRRRRVQRVAQSGAGGIASRGGGSPIRTIGPRRSIP